MYVAPVRLTNIIPGMQEVLRNLSLVLKDEIYFPVMTSIPY